MKIKKYLAWGLSALTIMAMVGCSSNDSNANNNKDNNISQGGKKENEGSEETTYLGKVKNIVGNEIEIELAKDQDVSGNGSKLPEGVEFSESIGGDSDSAAEGDIPLTGDNGEEGFKDSISMDSSSYDGEIFSLGEQGDNEKLELEYTGETVKFTIPTGANIFDMRSRSDSKLSAIKTNSIIKIFAKGTKEATIVKSVDIVE